jgi:oligosaccharide repeat unit polymerase
MHLPSNSWAIVVTVFVVACLVYDLRRDMTRIVTGRTVVLITVLYWYLLEALRMPDALARYTPAEYRFGLWCVALAVAAFLTGYHGSKIGLFKALQRRLFVLDNPRLLWRIFLLALVIGFGSLLIYVEFNVAAFLEGLTGMTRRWTGSLVRGRYGSWWTLLFEMQMFLEAAIPLAVCLAAMRRVPAFQRTVASVFIVWMFVRTLFSGSRAHLLPIALCVAAALFWRAGPSLRRGLIAVGLPLALVGGFLLSAIIVAGRNVGKFDVESATSTQYVGYEMFRELLFIVRAEQEGLPAEWGLTYFTQLVNPIPRAIWPNKPVSDAGLILARAYGAIDRYGEPSMTASPGFLGEAYLNFRLLGLLFVPALAGVIVRAWDRLLPVGSKSLPAFLVYAAGLAAIFASGRSFNMSTFYGLLALFVLLVALEQMGWTPRRNRLRPQFQPARGRHTVERQAAIE